MKHYIKTYSIESFAKLLVITSILGGFSLGVFAAPPNNDNFASAEVVSGIQVHILRMNVEATKEAGEPNHAGNPGGKSVWFKWTAPMTRVMAFTTNHSGNNLDTLIHIYTGTALNNLASITLNNNINAPNDLRSFARTRVSQGITYYIAVDGFSGNNQPAAEGDFLLDIQPSFQFQGADYDADGMTDLANFRPSDGTWNVIKSSDGQTATRFWGTNGDIPIVSSISGSGINEYDVFRPSEGIFYHRPNCCSDYYLRWGTSGDIPVPASYGGGEATTFAVFRPSDGFWYIYFAPDNYRNYLFGQAGDSPVPGNYTPDDFADIAVFRPSNGTWYFINRKSNILSQDTFSAVQFGQAGDKPVPADYDGDGLLDVAVYRPSTGAWYVLQSSDNQFQGFQWGTAEDIPTTGDYDGDGKSDFAVFRPSNGFWYIHRSGDNTVQSK